MANLYVTEQNSVIRKTGDRLIVQKKDAVLLDVQCRKLDAVLIFGNVQFTTQVVHELMEHDIELAILTRTGRLVGQLTPPAPRNITIRLKQFQRYADPGFRLQYSRRLVAAKIANCRRLVLKHLRNHPQADVGRAAGRLARLGRAAGKAESLEALLGIEGSAAHVYFGAFGSMILAGLGFPGRRKRPPTDPVNALLSLGYTMLFNESAALLDATGFDPYLGFYHGPDYGRASLAADLMEPLRAPVTDRFTLNALNMGIFKADAFKRNPRGGAVYLRRNALRRYFDEYEDFMSREYAMGPAGKSSMRSLIRRQAEALAHSIREGAEFEPFLWTG